MKRQAQKVLALARALEKRAPCRVETWDERLTTALILRGYLASRSGGG